MKQKILVICPFPQGVAAGQRLKYEQYFNDWMDSNFEVTISPFMNVKMWNIVYFKGNYWLKIIGTLRGYFVRIVNLFHIKKYDIVYVFMWVTPIGTSIFERMFRRLSNHLIYDIEDNIMMGASNAINPVVKALRGPGKTQYLIENADHVITSSPFLNDYCKRRNFKKKCTYISSSIDTNKFIPVNNYLNDHKIIIGWTGTFTSVIFLDLLRDSLVELSKRCQFKLRVIGNFEYALPGVDLEVIQWTSENEVSDLQKIDIGIYPLEMNEWVFGKSGLKVIQYMSFGLPTVSTDIGTTSKIISHMENGLLVKTNEEWVDSLELLINDSSLRKRLGTSARKSVLEKYSQSVIKTEYLSILNKL
jgi:glycosyltransferase involved in cell wall biosynthesis